MIVVKEWICESWVSATSLLSAEDVFQTMIVVKGFVNFGSLLGLC